VAIGTSLHIGIFGELERTELKLNEANEMRANEVKGHDMT
jgi:hypothetical protein